MEKSNNKGISLVELLVAVVIVGIAMSPILMIFLKVRDHSNRCYQRLVNTVIACDIMERMLRLFN